MPLLQEWIGPITGDLLEIGSRDSSILAYWTPRSYVGVDPSRALLDEAARKYDCQSYTFVQSDIEEPWCEDGTFAWSSRDRYDAVLCLHDMLGVAPNWNQILATVSCLLKEDGVFIGRISSHTWFDKILQRILPKWFRTFDSRDVGDGTMLIRGVL